VAIARSLYRAPNANAVAERWVRSIRQECLDHLLLLNEAHLHRVLTAYADYYNRARPHQGLNQHTPVAPAARPGCGPIRRRARLGGLLGDYYRAAAWPALLTGLTTTGVAAAAQRLPIPLTDHGDSAHWHPAPFPLPARQPRQLDNAADWVPAPYGRRVPRRLAGR
jgi:hypothetical protein